MQNKNTGPSESTGVLQRFRFTRGSRECTAAMTGRQKPASSAAVYVTDFGRTLSAGENFKLVPWCAGVLPLRKPFVRSVYCWALGLFQNPDRTTQFQAGAGQRHSMGGRRVQRDSCCARFNRALMSPDRAAAEALSPPNDVWAISGTWGSPFDPLHLPLPHYQFCTSTDIVLINNLLSFFLSYHWQSGCGL